MPQLETSSCPLSSLSGQNNAADEMVRRSLRWSQMSTAAWSAGQIMDRPRSKRVELDDLINSQSITYQSINRSMIATAHSTAQHSHLVLPSRHFCSLFCFISTTSSSSYFFRSISVCLNYLLRIFFAEKDKNATWMIWFIQSAVLQEETSPLLDQ